MGCGKEGGGGWWWNKISGTTRRSTVHPRKNVVPGGKQDQQSCAEPVRTIRDMIRAPKVVSTVFSSQLQSKFPTDKTFSGVTDLSSTLQLRAMNLQKDSQA